MVSSAGFWKARKHAAFALCPHNPPDCWNLSISDTRPSYYFVAVLVYWHPTSMQKICCLSCCYFWEQKNDYTHKYKEAISVSLAEKAWWWLWSVTSSKNTVTHCFSAQIWPNDYSFYHTVCHKSWTSHGFLTTSWNCFSDLCTKNMKPPIGKLQAFSSCGKKVQVGANYNHHAHSLSLKNRNF